MLLFKPEHAPMILAGTKTQTRRTWAKSRVRIGQIYQCKLNFKKGSGPFALVKVTALRLQRLGEITPQDARAEGYADIAAYQDIFIKIYGGWDPLLMVWVVDFELVEAVK